MAFERALLLFPSALAVTLALSGCRSTDSVGLDDSKGRNVKRYDGELPEEPEVVGDKDRAHRTCNVALAPLPRLDELATQPETTATAVAQQLEGRGKYTTFAWIERADEALGRVDEGSARDRAFIEGRLEQAAADNATLPQNLAAITMQIRVVAFLEMRRLLGEVTSGRATGPDASGAWTAAGCLFLDGLIPLSAHADKLGGEEWTQNIRDAFGAGNAGLLENNLDPVKVAKQQIEKSMYAVAYRLIIAAAEARTPVNSAEALGLLEAIEDRLADRNGPGLARMREQFSGSPDELDPALIERELAVAFTKRARKYCDKAVVKSELGSPDAIAETWEGIVYTKVILSSMREALEAEGFDADAYMADWQRYLEAVKTSDAATAGEISPRLVEWNCAFQEHLKIAECASATNEEQ